MTDRRWTDADATRFWEDPSADPAVADVVSALEGLGLDEDADRGAPVVAARRRRTTGFVLAAAAVLAIFISGALLAAVVGGEDGVVIAAAEGVTVVEEDGSTRTASRGSEVPHGSVVVVTGFVDVGDGPLGPGRYRVDDGALVALDRSPLESTTGESTATTGPPVDSTDGVGSDDDVDPAARPAESESPVPTSAPSDDAPTDRTDPTPTTTVVRPDVTRPATTTPAIDRPPTSTEPPVDDRPTTTAGRADPPATSVRVDARPAAPPTTRPSPATTEVAVGTTTVDRGRDTTTTVAGRDR